MKRILQEIALDKIACVDKPCQEHAIVAIMKREEEPDPQVDPIMVKLADTIAGEMLSGEGNTLRAVVAKAEDPGSMPTLLRALKHSLVSITTEDELAPQVVRAMAANNVQQFIDTMKIKREDVEPILATARLQKAREQLLVFKSRISEPVRVKINPDILKQGYYVGLKGKDGCQHFSCEAGNRRGARSQAMHAHPEHTIYRVHEKGSVKKIWSDKARAAAAEARRARHASMGAKHSAQPGKMGGPHATAEVAHNWASRFYEDAARHYASGDRVKGKRMRREAKRQGKAANRMSANLRSPGAKALHLAGRAGLAAAGIAGLGYGAGYLRDKYFGKIERVKLNKIKPGQMRHTAHPRVKGLQEVGLQTIFTGDTGHFPAAPLAMARLGKEMLVFKLTNGIDLSGLVKKLPANAKAGDYIHDFVNSSNPRFEGKSKKERIRQALGAYYASKG